MTQGIIDVAKRLKLSRQRAGYRSAREFAMKFGFKVTTYAQHESGKRAISIENAKMYSKLLNLHPAWLMTGVDYAPGATDGSLADGQEMPLGHVQGPFYQYLAPVSESFLTEVMQKVYEAFYRAPVSEELKKVLQVSLKIYSNIVPTSRDANAQQQMLRVAIDSLVDSLHGGLISIRQETAEQAEKMSVAG